MNMVDKAVSTFNSSSSFINQALHAGALTFGDFQAKSGRSTPYFFNSSVLLANSQLLYAAARRCAELIAAQHNDFDVLFGVAYKGIPLAAATAVCLLKEYNIDKAVAYNRKEAKQRGEGGLFAGAALNGQRVLLLDDVLTTGTACTQLLPAIKAAGGQVVQLIVLFDRQEVTMEGQPTRPQLENVCGIKIQAAACLQDLFDCCHSADMAALSEAQMAVLKAYREKYGY